MQSHKYNSLIYSGQLYLGMPKVTSDIESEKC